MKILELTVEGFRSLNNIYWRPGDLNVIIGPNGTGKSNLLRLLEFVSVSANGRLSKYVQSSEGIEPLLWDGRSSEISFSIEMSPLDGLVPLHNQTYRVELERLGFGSDYRIRYEQLADYHLVHAGTKGNPFKHLERQYSTGRIFDEGDRALIATEDEIVPDELLLSQMSGLFINNKWIPAIRQYLSAWSVYHDLHVNRDAAIRQSVVARSEKRVAPDGQNLTSVLHTLYTGDRHFKQSINSAMRAAFGNDFDELIFPPAADQRIQLRVRWKTLRNEQSAADLSDGTLRFLFLLTVLGTPSPAPLIAIDEPETGLHPSMLPIVAEYAVDAAQRSQVILTTHSDQLLDAFGDTRPTTTVAKWTDGETELATLDNNELAYWLKEYSLGALYRSRELENMP